MNFLFRIDEEFTEEAAGVYSSLMPPERRQRFIACRDALHRKQIVAAYLLLCYGLGKQFGDHSVRLTFDYSGTGKPYLHHGGGRFFSLSHSGEYVLCSIAECEIGADVQTVTAGEDGIEEFSVAESLLKLKDGTEAPQRDVKTYFTRESDHVIAISSYGDIERDIALVRLSDLTEYLARFTTIGQYVRLNRYGNAFCVKETPLQMFRRSVELYGGRPAVSFKGKSITYRELDRFSDAIARRLTDAGVRTGDKVLLAVQPGIEFSVAEFAIIKAGGTYVPVYKRWPIERVDYIIRECKIKVALFGREELFWDCSAPIRIVCCDYDDPDVREVQTNEEENGIHNIIYTSGSTGNPKGVMIPKTGIASFSSDVKGSYYREIVHSEYVRVACICPISFDMSVAENTTTLLNGGTVIFADDEDQYPENFGEFILQNEIDVIWATPSKFKMYLQSEVCRAGLQRLKIAVLAGEVLDFEIARLSANFPFRLYNTYGPTETTIVSTYYPVTKVEPNVPIGIPFANESCYVIGSDGELCEVGEKGELYIAGECVAAGYNQNPTQTAERFFANPFGHGRIYNTGDLASLESDGLLHFYGRKDNQVKVNGFRVELEEIESVISQLARCKTVVQYHEGKLVAFLESRGSLDLGDRLKQLLPDYMIPSQIYYVDRFPLNHNDKTDKKTLLKLLAQKPSVAYVAPQTALQKKIADCWSKYLNVKVGIDDEFSSLGGDSICAMRIASELRRGGLNISMFDIMNGKTVRNLCAGIEDRDGEQVRLIGTQIDPAVCAPVDAEISLDAFYEYRKNFDGRSACGRYVPLKMHRSIMRSTSGCDRIVYRVDGTKDKDLIRRALRSLIAGNAAFRTVYDCGKDECIQFGSRDDWIIPTIRLETTNKKFSDAVQEVSLVGETQFLSYVFLAEERKGDLYIVIMLHWRFCDRGAVQLIQRQLTGLLNRKTLQPDGITDPMEYTQSVRKGAGTYGAIPEEVSAMLAQFADAAGDQTVNRLLNGHDCIHFNCTVAMDERLKAEFVGNPLNFVVGLFSRVLHHAYPLERIPIYVVDRNRNALNENLVDTVIDFLPLVVSEKEFDYYGYIKAIRGMKHENSILIESGEWNTGDGLLPFVNYISVLNEGDKTEIEVREKAGFGIREEMKHDDRISCSAFLREGSLMLSFSLPIESKDAVIRSLEELTGSQI